MLPIKLLEKFDKIKDHWSPKIVGELNGQQVKLAKIKGQFIWHSHPNEDELFWVLKGTLIMEFRDKTEKVQTGEILIVPKGVEHRPATLNNEEVFIAMFEPASTLNTGDQKNERTVEELDWI